jgi:hypothetical protein
MSGAVGVDKSCLRLRQDLSQPVKHVGSRFNPDSRVSDEDDIS